MSTPVAAAKPEAASGAGAQASASAGAQAGAASAKVPRILDKCQNIADLREAARRRLPRGVFEFFDRGSEDEASLKGNREAFARIKLRNKVLVDVSRRSMATTLFGKPMSMPLAIAPTGRGGRVLVRGRGGAGPRRREGGRAVHAGDALRHVHRDDRGGGGRAQVVPALHVARARTVLCAGAAGEGRRLRGADPDGGHARAADPRIQSPQRLLDAVPAQSRARFSTWRCIRAGSRP